MSRTTTPEAIAERCGISNSTLILARHAIRLAIITAHPAARPCLPLPDLQIPESSVGYDPAITQIGDNLFTSTGHAIAQPWIRAFGDGCSHLAEPQVRILYELVYDWYRLLIDADMFIKVASRRYDLDRTVARVAVRVEEVLTFASPAETTPTN
ncbi:hypothetical protein GCM10010411_76450 [Actinomadura fulvescens]|uniref:Uncharacterized protein n=1 Tax=Actinomadura fulvescens TaxID=46160 RepID=A0ABN3QJC6_9ACTN